MDAATSRGPVRQATLVYPHCGHASVEIMPEDACIYFCECTGCRAMLRPKPGDCCVFCAYASVPCPSMQDGRCGTSAKA